jgi:cobalt-zinc-cadmium efflux system membrane fusion protein
MVFPIGAAFALYACSGEMPGASSADSGADSGADSAGEPGAASAPERGPHNGRLLADGDFVLELAIYETGVPPEFRAWATENGQAVPPEDVNLEVELTRLDETDRIEFRPQADFLRSTSSVHEPHSFVVSIDAAHEGRRHHWNYESFEGRTRISPEMAEAFGIATSVAGPAVLEEQVTLYGQIVPDAERVREIRARFDGAIRSVTVSLGQTVRAGQPLAEIESNESLKPYTITAPMEGVVMERSANAGEQTAGRRLFTIVDISSVWANLAVFLDDRARVRVGAPVILTSTLGSARVEGTIAHVDVVAGGNQAVTARVVLDNGEGVWALGAYVTADVRVAEIDVPLAVERKALQPFRDFMVVYAEVGDVYEVRMLELGRQAGDWVEVLGGLKPGTRYVTENSYVLKADIEKSGASHDH